MKKIITITAFCFLVSLTAKSQQLPLYSQYMMNSFLLNPAIAGSKNYTPLILTARQQWTGITGAPQTFAISGHTLFKNDKVGMGGSFFNDRFGPTSRTGVQASYAYHLAVDRADTKLAFGLAASAFQYKLDESSLTVIEQDDPAFSQKIESTFMPDATFGIYLYNKNKFFAGLSIAQLFQFKIKINEFNENKMVRHYFLTGGYKFNLGDDFEIEPSVLLKSTASSPIQLDINTKAYFKKNYWLGVSYRTNDAIIVLLGVKVDKYYIGYAFDYTLSKIINYSTGSHEIMIGINLGEDKGIKPMYWTPK